MKGVLLLGGTGHRLAPITDIINKHILLVYDRSMLNIAVEFLAKSGIMEIIAVCDPKSIQVISRVLKDVNFQGVRFTYIIQSQPLGTAHALSLCHNFLSKEPFVVVFGDNVFEYHIRFSLENNLRGALCKLFLTEVENPQDYGVVKITGNHIQSIEDKPAYPLSRTVCSGCFIFHPDVLNLVDLIQPNNLGELDIMDLVRLCWRKEKIIWEFIQGRWIDAGTNFEELHKASCLVKNNGVNKDPQESKIDYA